MRHGWFVVPGVQTGDRTLATQLQGLEPALAECAGKTVLDIGCAEGLLSFEFARRGATSVHGMDIIEGHLEVAQELVGTLPCTFEHADLGKLSAEVSRPERSHDIVLALAMVHKLWSPRKGLQYVSRRAKDLLLMRVGKRHLDDIIISKRNNMNAVRIREVLDAEGFVLEKTVAGSSEFGEAVQYWRRRKA